MSKKSKPQTTTQVANNEPWKAQVPYLQEAFRNAATMFRREGDLQYYPRSTVAGRGNKQIRGGNAAIKAARGTFTKTSDAANKATQGMLDKKFLDVNKNPGVQGAIQAATRPITTRLDHDLNNITSAAENSGAFGGARHGLAETGARDVANMAIGDASSNIAFNAFNELLNAQTTALGLAPQTAAMSLVPGAVEDAVGQQEQMDIQRRKDAAVARHNYEQQRPYNKLQFFSDIISGNHGGMSTGSTMAPGTKSGPMQTIGAGISGASLATSMMPGVTAAGPVGAGLGLALALFG